MEPKEAAVRIEEMLIGIRDLRDSLIAKHSMVLSPVAKLLIIGLISELTDIRLNEEGLDDDEMLEEARSALKMFIESELTLFVDGNRRDHFALKEISVYCEELYESVAPDAACVIDDLEEDEEEQDYLFDQIERLMRFFS